MRIVLGVLSGILVAAAWSSSASAQTVSSHVQGAAKYVDSRGRTIQPLCSSATQGANRYRCFAYKILGAASLDATPDSTCRSSSGQFANARPNTFTPVEIQKAYGLTNAPPSGGAVVAVVDLYGYAKALSDLNVYRKKYGIPELPSCTGTVPKVGDAACFANIDQDGNPSQLADDPQGANGWGGEAALDMDMVSAACPDCSIVLVSIDPQSSSNDAFGAGVATVASLIPGLAAISNSYGGPEQGNDDDSNYTQKGVLVLAASGDQDYLDEGFGRGAKAPNFPASSPHVLSIGGTTPKPSATSSRGFDEVAWDVGIDPQTNLPAGGGSGCSTEFARPSWQTIDDPSCSRRASVDVSAAADYDSLVKNDAGHEMGGISVYAGGCWTAVGGTSAATPLVAAILARLKLATKVANDFSLVYKNPSAFNDVTEGSNDPTHACTDVNCTAGPGWDGPTGMGTPNGPGLCALAGLQCASAAEPDAGSDMDAGKDASTGGPSPEVDAGHPAQGAPSDAGTTDGSSNDTPPAAQGGGGSFPSSSSGCAASPFGPESGAGAAAALFGIAAAFTRRRRPTPRSARRPR